MRRFVAGFLIAFALGIGAGVAGAVLKDGAFNKVTASDFEGGIANFTSASFRGNTGSAVVGISDANQLQLFYQPGFFLNVSAGNTDPTVAPCKPARAGSLYLEHNGDGSGGQAFVKTGMDTESCGWTRIAP